jgi:hypothetical protein
MRSRYFADGIRLIDYVLAYEDDDDEADAQSDGKKHAAESIKVLSCAHFHPKNIIQSNPDNCNPDNCNPDNCKTRIIAKPG